MDSARLRRVAGRQFGVFSRAQAHASGFSTYQIRRRLHDGEWQTVLGNGMALAGLTVTELVRDRAAQLSVPGSILGGPSAARTWQLPVPDPRPCLYIGANGRTRVTGIRLIREEPSAQDVSMFQGLPTTGRSCAVVDCLRFLPEPAALTFLDRALQQGWISLTELVDRVHGRSGRRGHAALVTLVHAVASGERSAAERRLATLLRDAGITGWRLNAEVRDDRGLIGVADVLFGQARVVVEVDGWAYHSTPDRFQRDRERQNRLVAAGWTVLRFTWRDLTHHPERVIATVLRLL